MPVVRIYPEDSEETKKRKLEEIEKAKRSLKATRERIAREFNESGPHHRFG